MGLCRLGVDPRPPECGRFLELPPKQRTAEFRTYSIDRQIEMYLCAMGQEPPDSGLAFEVLSDRRLLHWRKDVVIEISDVIDSMTVDSIRQDSLERLKKIEINSGIKPFTYTH